MYPPPVVASSRATNNTMLDRQHPSSGTPLPLAFTSSFRAVMARVLFSSRPSATFAPVSSISHRVLFYRKPTQHDRKQDFFFTPSSHLPHLTLPKEPPTHQIILSILLPSPRVCVERKHLPHSPRSVFLQRTEREDEARGARFDRERHAASDSNFVPVLSRLPWFGRQSAGRYERTASRIVSVVDRFARRRKTRYVRVT